MNYSDSDLEAEAKKVFSNGWIPPTRLRRTVLSVHDHVAGIKELPIRPMRPFKAHMMLVADASESFAMQVCVSAYMQYVTRVPASLFKASNYDAIVSQAMREKWSDEQLAVATARFSVNWDTLMPGSELVFIVEGNGLFQASVFGVEALS